MPFTVSKQFIFAAAHSLPMMPEGHKCRNLHGHNYVATITLGSRKLRQGMVVDFGDITEFWKTELEPHLDHRLLSEVPELRLIRFNLTAECLAAWIFTKCEERWPRQVVRIRVQETPSAWAEYSSPDPWLGHV